MIYAFKRPLVRPSSRSADVAEQPRDQPVEDRDEQEQKEKQDRAQEEDEFEVSDKKKLDLAAPRVVATRASSVLAVRLAKTRDPDD